MLSKIARFLVLKQIMTEAQMIIAEKEALFLQLPLLSYFIQYRNFSASTLAHLIADKWQLPFYDLAIIGKESVLSKYLQAPWMATYRVLPLKEQEKKLIIAVDDPTQDEIIQMIQFHTGSIVSLVIVEGDKLDAMRQKLLNVLHKEVLPADFVQYWLSEAMKKNASDIHVESYENFSRLRFRLDGLLAEITTIPPEIKEQVVAYLKVMAHLDTSERRRPQEGRFQLENKKGETIDCRMSTCPTINGEKIVIRLLARSTMQLDIEHLGLNVKQKKILLETLKQPQGMVFVTGPTGSGKTVTLYTALSLLNKPEKNICTVEDPVEIKLSGINQVGINIKTGLTFAKILRTFLRQDPDIMMIGEIRDLETAQIAVSAAQTGHLVFSTLHANSAVETLTRLLHMGVKPFQIADSIQLIIAQRLVRKSCPYCYDTKKGCEHCYHGYKGRVGLFECLLLTPEFIHQLAMGKIEVGYLTRLAKEQGMTTLYESGLEKIALNLTTEEEVLRVLGGNEIS